MKYLLITVLVFCLSLTGAVAQTTYYRQPNPIPKQPQPYPPYTQGQQQPYYMPQQGQPQQQQQLPQQQQAYAAQAQIFPKLPPSRACTAADLVGIWKLLLLYETPVGTDMTDFLTNPVQYLVFNNNNTYGKIVSEHQEIPPGGIHWRVSKLPGLNQYIIDSSGFVFFYQDKQAIDTQACFIVVVQQEPFNVGQMLLMPPQGQTKERLLKIYGKVDERPQPQQPKPQPQNRGRR
jgi:hypothetical protein